MPLCQLGSPFLVTPNREDNNLTKKWFHLGSAWGYQYVPGLLTAAWVTPATISPKSHPSAGDHAWKTASLDFPAQLAGSAAEGWFFSSPCYRTLRRSLHHPCGSLENSMSLWAPPPSSRKECFNAKETPTQEACPCDLTDSALFWYWDRAWSTESISKYSFKKQQESYHCSSCLLNWSPLGHNLDNRLTVSNECINIVFL